MSFDPNKLVHPFLLALKPYVPGKPIAETQRELGLSHIIKLASNENPLGTSQHVSAALKHELHDLARYPDGNAFLLKEALADHLGVHSDQLLIGNGSEDVLRQVMQTFVWDDFEIIVPAYSFIAYKILAKGMGLVIHEIPRQVFKVDLDAMLAAVNAQTRLIILDNPSNPIGTYISSDKLAAFLSALPENIIVVLDEAYYEYLVTKDYPQTIPWLNQYPNLIITRTFSKVYGLAGLRCGYGIASKEIVALVNRVRQPFNVNHLAQVGAWHALQDQTFVQEAIEINEAGKQQYEDGFKRLALPYQPGAGNFIMVNLKSLGSDIYSRMLKQGIIIRPLMPYGLEDEYRITIGLKDENEACLRALERCRENA